MTLDELQIGASAKVKKIAGAPSIRRRLMEMGITPACVVEAVRRAPLGDPLEVKLRGYFLSLRKEEAQAVEIE